MINGIFPTQSKLFTDGIKAEIGKVLVERLYYNITELPSSPDEK